MVLVLAVTVWVGTRNHPPMGVTATVRGLRFPLPAGAAEPEELDYSQFPMRFNRVDRGPGIRFDCLAGEDGKAMSLKSNQENPSSDRRRRGY
jgi:hypothetical protein